MQEGGTVDPVSGNDVPPGAMAEEVRDDIDAKLSEGEFVIPADVVRYIGLEKLMMMRDKAKAGLKRMADIGQMGNAEEVEDAEALHGDEEMDDDSFSSEIDSILGEENEQEYAKGGDVRKYAAGGYVGGEENKQLYADAPIRGFEMVAMTNDAGQTIYIPFINGVAQLSVPSGYKVKSSAASATPTPATPDTTPAAPTSGDGGGGGGSTTVGGNTDGSTVGGGQGISNTAIAAGLGSMAFGQSAAGKALSAILGIPASSIANVLGGAVVDQQMDAISSSFDAMSDANTLGGQLGTVSDESGNISTVSNQGITDAFDQATFGTTSSQMSAESAANAAQAAETGMTTNAQGQTVSNDASIAAQDAATFGDGGGSDSGGSDTSGGYGGVDSGGYSGDGSGGYYAKGGFVSKKKTKKTSKQTSLASRRK